MKVSKRRDRIIGILYLGSSLSLALFCLFQSQRMSHDQSARDLASRSIRTQTDTPQIGNALIPTAKKIGEESD